MSLTTVSTWGCPRDPQLSPIHQRVPFIVYQLHVGALPILHHRSGRLLQRVAVRQAAIFYINNFRQDNLSNDDNQLHLLTATWNVFCFENSSRARGNSNQPTYLPIHPLYLSNIRSVSYLSNNLYFNYLISIQSSTNLSIYQLIHLPTYISKIYSIIQLPTI